jgi:hypothetical protein
MQVEIANVEHPEKSRTLDFVLDSEAIKTVVPEDVLSELGITPCVEDPGGRRRGVALFRYDDEHIGGGDVVFGEPGGPAVLSWITLGSLGFDLDRATGELKPMPMLLA